MTPATGKRQYTACVRCRKRKAKCDLTSIGQVGKPPCIGCFRTGRDCILAVSRRGGNHRKGRNASVEDNTPTSATADSEEPPRRMTDLHRNDHSGHLDDREALHAELNNPSDALQILAHASHQAGLDDNQRYRDDGSVYHDCGGHNNSNYHQHEFLQTESIRDYELVAAGALQPEDITHLVQIYADRYHPFLPIVPKHVLSLPEINRVCQEEIFLFTVIITIASMDEPLYQNTHHQAWAYTKKLLLDILLALPATHHVGTVEGLLLLADWIPYIVTESAPGRRNFIEDNTAWSLVGQAVRHAYLLRLDRSSFPDHIAEGPMEEVSRRRLTWIFVYLADRQISVRMGQSFWSRGPSLSSRLSLEDFAALRPQSTADEDYPSILLATVELTQILHNAHDILYSSKSKTGNMIRRGDYSRCLDDFLKSLHLWHESWSALAVSPKLRSTLLLMYEYLRVYVNAFSFQAVITRSIADRKDSRKPMEVVFPCGIMGSPDGPYISEAIRAAKMVLTIMCEMDSSTCLGCLPSRYYLYGIYSAVFLYKTHMFGSFTAENEHRLLLPLITDFIDALKKAATSKMHPGYRFSKLLQCLWFHGTMASLPSSQSGENASACDSNRPRVPESTTQASDSALQPTMPESSILPGYFGEEPIGFMSSTSGVSGDFEFLESLFGLNEVNMLPPFGNTYPA